MKKIYIVFFAILYGFKGVFAQPIPVFFDLRNVNGDNFVTSVKSQQGGTCWTHGAMASIEGNMLKTNIWTQSGEQGEPALAEYHLDWWNGFNQHNNDDYVSLTGNGLAVHNGGDYRVTAAYLSRGEGAVRDVDAPGFNTAPLRFDSSYHFYYPRTIEWFNVGQNLERINTVKQQIMNQGVIGTCMCVGFWANGNVHYQPPYNNTEPNHAVAIIGWNDTIQTPAASPGAWLVKNSWGTSWGDSGYFWISYYDKHCGQEPQMGAVSFQEVEPLKYKSIFYHDYHGWRDELQNCSEGFNVFVNDNSFKKIEALSFYNATDSVSFSAVILGDFKNGVLSDTLSVVNGFINHIGFHTIDLDSVGVLNPNDTFYLYLYISAGGQPYDRTSEVPVLLGAYNLNGPLIESKSNLGESYYRIGSGGWQDLHNFDTTANFCMKALSNPLLPLHAANPHGDTLVCSGAVATSYSIPSTPYTSSYAWQLTPITAGVLIANDTTATINWSSGFSGNVKLTVTPNNSNGAGGKGTVFVNFYQQPIVNLGNDTSVLEHHSITFNINQNYAAYLWSNGALSSSATFSGLNLGIGSHQIWVEVTDTNLCKNSDTLMLEVQSDAGIEHNDLAAFKVYPNPVESEIYFELSTNKAEDAEIIISDVLGQVLHQRAIILQPNIDRYEVSGLILPSGIYSLTIRFKEETRVTRFIIK